MAVTAMIPVDVIVNGRSRRLSVEADETVLDTLRSQLGLTGAKPGCEVGTCGSCTVLVDDRAIYGCLVLSAELDGDEVSTVEGLADGPHLSVLQRAFIECDALQCGFCTPGQLMSLEALRRIGNEIDSASIESAVHGNLCRCGAYRHILEAAEAALIGTDR